MGWVKSIPSPQVGDRCGNGVISITLATASLIAAQLDDIFRPQYFTQPDIKAVAGEAGSFVCAQVFLK